MKKINWSRFLVPLVGTFLWFYLTGILLELFISRPMNSLVQLLTIFIIVVYTFVFFMYIYTRITNKNK